MTFRVGASPSLGHSILPQMLARLSANYPGLTIQFDILSVGQAIDYLALQRGEYALTVFPIDHPNILSSRIGAGRMVCTVPSQHPLADRDRIGVADLAAAQLQSFRPDTPHDRIIADMFARAGQEPDVSTYIRFAETAVAFAANGMGVALVNSFTAMQSHADTVRFLEFEDPAYFRSISPAIWNRHAPSSAKPSRRLPAARCSPCRARQSHNIAI